jgi:ferric-dicitrate binding protein FerR (iron transport regulator)
MGSPGKTIEREAFSWMVRQRDGLSPAEHEELEAWLASSPQHWAAFSCAQAEVRQLGALLTQIPRERLLVQAPPDRGRRRLLAAAGTLAAGAAATWLGAAWLAQPRERRYITGAGVGPQVIALPGLKMVLAAATEVLIVQTGPRSGRLLRGEALFTVTAATLPFIVHAGDWLLSTPQASFTLHQAATDVDLILQSGQVEVRRMGLRQPVTRLAGLEAGLLRGSGTLEVRSLSEAELRSRLQWCSPESHLGAPQMLFFVDRPLREVAAELNRHGGGRVAILDSALGARRITAAVPAGDLQTFISLVRSQLGAQVTEEDGEIRLFIRRD